MPFPATRLQILTALGNAVFAAAAWTATGYRVEPWTNFQGNMPCCFVRYLKDETKWTNQAASQLFIHAEIWIYQQAAPTGSGEQVLVPLADAIDAALAPDNPQTHTFTLGGLVQWCRVEGESEYDNGDLDNYAKLIIPIKIWRP